MPYHGRVPEPTKSAEKPARGRPPEKLIPLRARHILAILVLATLMAWAPITRLLEYEPGWDVTGEPAATAGPAKTPTLIAPERQVPAPTSALAAPARAEAPVQASVATAVAAPPRRSAEAPPADPTTATLPRAWTVQVMASALESEANDVLAQLLARGHAAYGVQALVGNLPVFRVRVGWCATREEAAALAERLRRQERLDTWIVREPATHSSGPSFDRGAPAPSVATGTNGQRR